jgi:hypothetical protein
MAGTTFVPSRESDLVTFANNFEVKLSAAPTDYGVSVLQATAFTTLNGVWNAAYVAANDPSTRSPANIAAKNTAKENMLDGPGGIRELAALVQAHPGITAQQLTELGLTVRDTKPTPVPPPTVSPEIDFIPTGTRTIRIRLHNETTLSKKKPDGVKGAMVFYHIGESAPVELSEWTFHESVTRTTLDVDLPASVAPGTIIWFTAYWFNPRQQSGPATTPVNTIMQFGGLAQAA